MSPRGDVIDPLGNSPPQNKSKVSDMRIANLVLSVLAMTASTLAFAEPAFDGALPVPEPETLALLGAGAVALLIARLRSRK